MEYRPSETVLKKLPQVTFVAIIGPTAVGKTTLMNAASARCPALHPVLVTTTRAPRPGEENDIDMHFRTREEIEARIVSSDYVQVAPNYTGELYVTAEEDYATEGISMMAVLADAMPLFRGLPFKTVRSIFILPPSWEVWQERIVEHNFMPDQLEKRMAEAGRSLRYALENPDVLFVINNDLAQSTMEFTQAALGATTNDDQYKSRDLVAGLLKELQNR